VEAGAMLMQMDAAGAMIKAASFDAVSTQAWARLLKACALSFLLHILLLIGIPVNPTGGVPQVVSTITARLEPAAADSEPAAESVALVPEPAPAPVTDLPQKSIEPKTEPKTEAKAEPPRAKEPVSSPSSGIELPFIRDPTYYSAKQLDVYPQPLAPIRLDYPESAASAKVDGRLLVLVLIDEFGVVNEVSVVESQPQGYFEEAAVASFRAARFSPAQRQGHAVKSRVMLRVKYLYGDNSGVVR
jgi:protein TonB